MIIQNALNIYTVPLMLIQTSSKIQQPPLDGDDLALGTNITFVILTVITSIYVIKGIKEIQHEKEYPETLDVGDCKNIEKNIKIQNIRQLIHNRVYGH